MVQHHCRHRQLTVDAVPSKQANCGLTETAAPNSATMRSSGLAPMLAAMLARLIGAPRGAWIGCCAAIGGLCDPSPSARHGAIMSASNTCISMKAARRSSAM